MAKLFIPNDLTRSQLDAFRSIEMELNKLASGGLTTGTGPPTLTSKLQDGSLYYDYTNLNFNQKKSKTSEVRHLETGRVEKGSDSDQSFTYDNSTFNTFATWSNWWKIKPVSEQVMVKEDLVTYCTECGSKRKKDSHKFCPHCGTKF